MRAVALPPNTLPKSKILIVGGAPGFSEETNPLYPAACSRPVESTASDCETVPFGYSAEYATEPEAFSCATNSEPLHQPKLGNAGDDVLPPTQTFPTASTAIELAESARPLKLFVHKKALAVGLSLAA